MVEQTVHPISICGSLSAGHFRGVEQLIVRSILFDPCFRDRSFQRAKEEYIVGIVGVRVIMITTEGSWFQEREEVIIAGI